MKIAALVSGGVDSSVALALLKKQGHDVTAFYLKIWLEEELQYLGNCPWEEDIRYATEVCDKFEIPLQIVNFQKEYHEKVVSYVISEVKAGRTPSPDLFCNQRIKFGAFLDKVGNDFEKIATGHYANIKEHNGQFFLLKAMDSFKDQTYFLSHLDQAQLSKLVFPIGGLLKSEVRDLACELDLSNKNRKDSQGICFLGKIRYSDFIKHHLGEKQGDFIEFDTGKKIACHNGFWFYTVGQRKGMGLSGGPWYVVDKDIQKNIVYISKTYFASDKKRDKFKIHKCNWISGIVSEKRELEVKLRHGESFYKCVLEYLSSEEYSVKIDGQDQGIAPGQFAVFYDNDVCLGCGVIKN